MAKVLYTDKKTGKERMLPEREAKILKALKRGTYETRDLSPLIITKPMLASKSVVSALLGEDESDAPNAPNPADINTLDQAGLHALAAELGIKLHPQTGVAKARKAIENFRAGKK